LRAARKREFLVDHRQNPPARRLDRKHRTVHVAQCVNRRLPYYRIFAGGHIAVGDVEVRHRA